MKTPYIACAAIWFNNDQELQDSPHCLGTGWVLCGHNHQQIRELYASMTGKVPDYTLHAHDGFLTSENHYVGRSTAALIALAAGQIKSRLNELTSEDIYKPF